MNSQAESASPRNVTAYITTNNGVAKLKTEICDADCRFSNTAWTANQNPTTTPWYNMPSAALPMR